MRSEEELRRASVPGNAGPDFRAEKAQGLALITPLNPSASTWLRATVSPEATWSGQILVVEIRYFAGIADAAIDAGFLFERNALPN